MLTKAVNAALQFVFNWTSGSAENQALLWARELSDGLMRTIQASVVGLSLHVIRYGLMSALCI